MKTTLVNELFCLRGRESMFILDSEPPGDARALMWFAAQLRTVSFPDDNFERVSHDGFNVRQLAVIGSVKDHNEKWCWVHMSPSTKEALGEFMESHGCQNDRWYYVIVLDPFSRMWFEEAVEKESEDK